MPPRAGAKPGAAGFSCVDIELQYLTFINIPKDFHLGSRSVLEKNS